MPPRLPSVVGQRFGRWTVLARDGGSPRVFCRCDCGTESTVNLGNLRQGASRSCGCLKREATAATGHARKTHGLSQTPLYQTWKAMHRRVTATNSRDWPYYGGRGIGLYEPWNDPAVFIAYVLAELGPRPVNATLDRIEADGDYAPGNIRWASRSEQSRNQRKRREGCTRRRASPG